MIETDEPDGVHVEGPISVVWRADADHEEADVAQSALVGRDETRLIGPASGDAERTFNSASLVSITPQADG